ncbi:hypothetical protein GQ53DRAFT_712959 [Thozetella sp. PMI_491]|nr:hypothetical protein GQ53DRAFT_712959 [Thozetella sp. PMI_491]
MPPVNQHSCVACARRKVKCDKLSPCSTCSRTQAACIYRNPAPSQRHRRQLTHRDLLSKIQELESLLRGHKIQFDPLDTSWVQSPWEVKLAKSPQPLTNPSAAVESTSSAEAQSPKLKNPLISQLAQPIKDEEEQSPKGDESSNSYSMLIPIHLHNPPDQLERHPHPKNAFKLWQSFVDNVNPLTKIIHAPTLQEKILGAVWSVESATRTLEATMFAVYALGVVSMKPADCLHLFGESRGILLARFRTGALQALSSIDLLSTRDLDVIQSLALILMIDHQSELSKTAVALALRIAHKMGLHRAAADSSISLFQQEMQVRLWWYIRGLNSRVRRSMGLLSTVDDLCNVRLPMNVNDADLHPHMTNPPTVQYTAATEMVYCLMKYDLWNFVRKPPKSRASNSLNPREDATKLVKSTSPESMTRKRTLLAEVESLLREKYLEHLDSNIPLQRLSIAIANITVHRQRFVMFHPRNQPECGRFMSEDDQDLVFESSVRLLELDREVRSTSFSTSLLDHMTCRTQVEALVYMVSELRQRATGLFAERAWAVLEAMHSEQASVLQGDHKFYIALADLTLEAWETRWHAIKLRLADVPRFIELLQSVREKPGTTSESLVDIERLQTGLPGDLAYEESFDWDHWNDLIQL